MNWKELTGIDQLEDIRIESKVQPVVVFKHSTRCSISSMAKSRLEKGKPARGIFYYLDLLRYREVSNRLAEDFQVQHQSPQVLLIRNGECTYEESHAGITIEELLEQMAA